MTIIKTIQRQAMVKRFGLKYNPNKRIQYVLISRKYYLEHMKEEFKLLIVSILMFVVAPFYVIWQIKECIQSLIPYSLVYTRKHLKDDPLKKQANFKDGEWDVEGD